MGSSQVSCLPFPVGNGPLPLGKKCIAGWLSLSALETVAIAMFLFQVQVDSPPKEVPLKLQRRFPPAPHPFLASPCVRRGARYFLSIFSLTYPNSDFRLQHPLAVRPFRQVTCSACPWSHRMCPHEVQRRESTKHMALF